MAHSAKKITFQELDAISKVAQAKGTYLQILKRHRFTHSTLAHVSKTHKNHHELKHESK